MRSSVLTIVLGKHLRAALLTGQSKLELARNIGVSPQKLKRMMNDEWEYITKDAIERAADYLELGVSDIFKFVPVDFWKPIEQTKRYVLVRGSGGLKTRKSELRIPWYDAAATGEVNKFVRESLQHINDPLIIDHFEDEDELMRTVKQENCLVIGSPKSNRATEIILSRFFGAVPFDPSDANRRKIPFAFCWDDKDPMVDRSSLTCSTMAREQCGNSPGIVLEDFHVPADFYPPESYAEWDTEEGRDCAILFVANKPFGTKHNVKLIVLAGFSGVGTFAAGKALVEDFRYLEPLASERCVYGVIESKYSKRKHKPDRKFSEFKWKYRHGGHGPFKFDKGKRSGLTPVQQAEF